MITTDTPDETERMREIINAKVLSEMAAEKAAAVAAQTRIAQQLHAEGSRRIEGIGQKIGSIDRRTYFRHHQENPGCMQDPAYVQQLLADTPKLCAPGYKAKKFYGRPSFVKVFK